MNRILITAFAVLATLCLNVHAATTATRITDNSNTVATVAAASTAPQATDPALVVTQSPNSPAITNQAAVQETIGSGKFNKSAIYTKAGYGYGNPTYVTVSTAYTAYATPTDLECISGSSTKTVAVVDVKILAQSTSATGMTLTWVKRSTANTGGTATNPTAIPVDSSAAAATGTVTLYTAAPTTGSVVGTVSSQIVATSTLTASPNAGSLGNMWGNSGGFLILQTPVLLHGTAESVCLNFAGAALPGGFSATMAAEWFEYTAP